MSKKIIMIALSALFLVTGCSKNKEKKEKVIGEDVKMFMSVKSGMDIVEVGKIFEKAEKEGLGKMKPIYKYEDMDSTGDEGARKFKFNKKADADSDFGQGQSEGFEGSETNGSEVDVLFKVDGDGIPRVKAITYLYDSDDKENGSLTYSFEEEKLDFPKGFDESYRPIIIEMCQKCSKEEVDKLLVDLTDGVDDEKDKNEKIKEIEKKEKEVWEREIGY